MRIALDIHLHLRKTLGTNHSHEHAMSFSLRIVNLEVTQLSDLLNRIRFS